MVSKIRKPENLAEFVDQKQMRGRITFRGNAATKELKLSPIAFNRAAQRLIKKGRLIHLVRGFYVIVPLEKQFSGSVDPLWLIEDLMGYLEEDYYVGLLSAASLYGASHQAVQEFQVVVKSQLKIVSQKNIRIRFLTKKSAPQTKIEKVKTARGFVKVSSPEETAFDLVRYLKWSGYINNSAMVLKELAEKLDPKDLLAISKRSAHALTQRLGYLLDLSGNLRLTKSMADWLKSQSPSIALLQPGNKKFKGKRSEKWFLIINEKVELGEPWKGFKNKK